MTISLARNAGALALCGLALGLLGTSTKALAAGGGGGGGGLNSVSTPLAMNGAGNIGPRGQATMTFDATQTIRTVTVQITNIHLPNGTVLNVVFTDNSFTPVVTPTGVVVQQWVPQVAGLMVVTNGTASLSISTLNGNPVPPFGTNGLITVNTVDASGNTLALYVEGVYAIGGRP